MKGNDGKDTQPARLYVTNNFVYTSRLTQELILPASTF